MEKRYDVTLTYEVFVTHTVFAVDEADALEQVEGLGIAAGDNIEEEIIETTVEEYGVN